jgi:SAM-dependent methyltransferase
MGKGAPLRWLENRLLARHLRGRGIEIGALWRRFPIPRRATVYYVDRLPDKDLRQHYAEVSTPVVNPDIVADAMQLPFAPRSLDFVIASHVLEHLPFPLAALRHWYDVLRPRGILLLKVPDKRYTFDAKMTAGSTSGRILRTGWRMLWDVTEELPSSTNSWHTFCNPTTAFITTCGLTRTSGKSWSTRAASCV